MTKRLFLVDAMSHIFRAFYAIRGLSNRKGMATNAAYGFAAILRKLINDEKPDYLCVAFDSAAPTFRHEQFEAYKANRAEMPEDLSAQMPYIFRFCEVLRLPIVRLDGFEADDLIGTLARKAAARGIQAVIVSNDKDMCQLVGDNIVMLRTDKNNVEWVDPAGVEKRLGVRPEQVVDLLGLWGDASDNIPGAPGIGEKGALQIIQQFGSIEKALENADQVSKKSYRESLKNNRDLILQSRELARIHTEAPIDVEIESLVVGEPDRQAAYALFDELDFTQWKKEMAGGIEVAAPAAPPAESARPVTATVVRKAETAAELKKAVTELVEAKQCAFATSGGRSLAIASRPDHAWLLSAQDPALRRSVAMVAQEILSNERLRKVTCDLKQLLTLFASDDFGGQRFEWNDRGLDDCMLAAYLIDPNRGQYDIASIAREYLGRPPGGFPDNLSGDDGVAIGASTALLELAPLLREQLRERQLLGVYGEIEIPLIRVLLEMERHGVLLDTAALKSFSEEITQELERLTMEIHTLAGREFNINSSQQLAEIFEELHFEVSQKTKTGRISTSADVLEELALTYELPQRVLEFRELTKLQSTYVDVLPKLINPLTGRVHTTFNQAVAATGRLSSSDPNLQNIPVRTPLGKRIRKAFIAPKGWKILSADYSQIELRILAHVANDEEMKRAFEAGEDIHASTARRVFGAMSSKSESEKRRLAKVVNFGIAYSVGAFGLAQRTGLSRGEAREVIEKYYDTYKGVKRYMEETPEKARETGVVRTLFGRVRPIPDIKSRNHPLRSRAEREAINAPIQGAAADIIKIAMISLHQAMKKHGLESKMILQVHDELVFEVPESEIDEMKRLVKREMESAAVLSVPLVVDIGVADNWLDAK